MTPEALERVAELVRGAARVVVSTGAGMSRESGIPTFRDAQEGLWARFDPAELATEAGFRAAPARVWSWYAYRRSRMAACHPHPGHRALVALEEHLPDFTIVTQNIDGLHQAAGSRDVIELHGSIHSCRCIDCGHPAGVAAAEGEASGADSESEVEPPRCDECDGHLRPDVVWFGELLPPEAMRRAWDLVERCDLLLIIGTSGVVWPAAELPGIARRRGSAVVEVNPEPSELTRSTDVFLAAPAGVALPALVEALGWSAAPPG